MTNLNKTTYLSDLQTLYERSLKDDNLALAVKIKEIQGKLLGFFEKNPQSYSPKNLKDYNDDELMILLRKLESSDLNPD